MSLGFKWANFKIVSALELDKWASETYATNFPHTAVVVKDIRSLSDQEILGGAIGFPDVVIGGPPCQGFSISNVNNKDPSDPRNTLFTDFIRIVGLLKPSVCLIENVKGLLSTRTSSQDLVIDVIEQLFESIGYNASHRLLNAKEYGVPQHRERLFIAAVRSDLGQDFSWPEPECVDDPQAHQRGLFPVRPVVSLWEAISDLPQITAGDGLSAIEYETQAANDFQLKMRKDAPPAICNHEPMKHTARIIERFKEIGYGQSEATVAAELKPRRRGDPSAMSDSAYSQNSRRQNPHRPCNTVVSSSHTNFIHPYLHRNFTVRELARIQSFSDDFVFRGKRAVLSKSLSIKKGYLDDIYLDQRMQIGNAVPPLLAMHLAHSVRKVIQNAAAKDQTGPTSSARPLRRSGGDVSRSS